MPYERATMQGETLNPDGWSGKAESTTEEAEDPPLIPWRPVLPSKWSYYAKKSKVQS